MTKRKRVRRDWPAMMQAQADSGLSVAAYCHNQGIAASLFYRWRQRCRVAPAAADFVELRPVERSPSASGVAVVTDAGWRLELEPGFDVATLERTLACATRSGVCSP